MVKTKKDIKKMRRAGKLAAECLEHLCNMAEPGVTPLEIDKECYEWTKRRGAIPAPLNYKGFPNSCCISVNDVVCHGIPDNRPLEDGDVVKIDVTPKLKRFHGDTCRTIIVGKASVDRTVFILVAHETMHAGINAVKAGAKLSDIANAVNDYVETTKYSLVKEYGGHGIGEVFHADPFVAFHPDHVGKDMELKAGMTITIEPMICMGKSDTKIEKDGWTVKTVDGSLSAQYEHTLLVTEDGCEVLTEYNPPETK